MDQLKIDPEFRDKIPPLTEAEYDQLRENILADGEVYEPIVVWNGTIVDGHNRWKIVQSHPGLPYRLKQMHFADKWAAFDWMYKKQLGRRNLTEEQRTYLIGKMYEARKQSVGAPVGHAGSNQHTNANSDKMSKLASRKDVKAGTAGEIGKEFGIDGKTVRRAEKFSRGVETLRSVSPEAAQKVLSGGAGVTKTTVSELAKADKETVQKIAAQIETGALVDNIKSSEKRKTKPRSTTDYAQARRNYQRIDEVSEIVSRNRGNEYTVDDAVAELEVIYTEFIDKARRVLQIRRAVINGDKKVLRLIYKFADEIENLKEELEIENPETSV